MLSLAIAWGTIILGIICLIANSAFLINRRRKRIPIISEVGVLMSVAGIIIGAMEIVG